MLVIMNKVIFNLLLQVGPVYPGVHVHWLALWHPSTIHVYGWTKSNNIKINGIDCVTDCDTFQYWDTLEQNVTN
jgi:hypothetical protein